MNPKDEPGSDAVPAADNSSSHPAIPQANDWSGHKLVGIAWPGANLGKRAFVRSDLSCADLRESDLSGSDLRGAVLRRANLSMTDLAGSDFSGCDLSEANLQGANLTRANLARATLIGANLLGANLHDSVLIEADCSGAIFSSARLSKITAPGAIFRGATLDGASFRKADLSGGDFSGASACGTNFDRVTLAYTVFTDCRAADAVFDFADMSHCQIARGSFLRCSFLGCACRGMRAVNTSFSSSDFYWAEVEGFTHCDCDFSDVRWSEAVDIACGPSSLKPPTIYPVPLYRRPLTEQERNRLLELHVALQSIR